MTVRRGKIFVGGINEKFTADRLKEIFSKAGDIESVDIYKKWMLFSLTFSISYFPHVSRLLKHSLH